MSHQRSKSLKQILGTIAISVLNYSVPRRLFVSNTWFRDWENLGLQIFPTDFNSPAPVIKELSEALWSGPSAHVGVDLRDEQQLRLLGSLAAKYKAEYDAFPTSPTPDRSQFYLGNGWFEKIDAEMLYSIVREFKPRKIVEIGSGFSTRLSMQAIHKNLQESRNHECEFLAIEPYPKRIAANEFPGTMRLIECPVQAVELQLFEQLQENDILFVDSSHICKTGSDVVFEVCEILPRLRKGVLVHVHDIYLPYEYPKLWVVEDRNTYNEQYILQAFLAFNSRFEVLWASYYMKTKYAETLRKAFASFDKPILPEERFLPSSLWLRRLE